MTDAAESQRSPRRKLGRYEIVAEIARGGMGTVYLARLEGVAGFQRLFALKLLHRHLAEEQQFVSMLLDEARLAARLHHPNAVGILDVSDSPLGYYLVMEYVDGFSLDQLLRRLDDPRRRARVGMRVFLDACAGLDSAHRLTDDDGNPLGIVHRDVSPQNILVGTDGAGRITDFGVARAAARITSSRPGMLKGKPCYMAPEQARGAEHLDARADVFALGIVLWEILAGRMLFQSLEGGAAVTLLQVCNAPIDPPSTHHEGLPAAIDDVVMAALERDLDARTASARELADALERVAAAEGWLASRHEVADAVAAVFAEEMTRRREAIRAHVDSLGESAAEPMLVSDIYDVPRLQSRPRGTVPVATPEPWHETPSPDASSGGLGLQETLASRPGSRRVGAEGEPSSGAKIASIVESPERSMRWAGVLAAVGLVLAGLAFLVATRGEEVEPAAPVGGAPTAAPAPEDPEEESAAPEGAQAAAPAEEAASAPVGEATAAEATAAEATAAEAAAAETARGPAAEASEAPEAASESRSRRAGRSPRAAPRPRPTETMTPRLETNPYLAR